MVSSRDKLKERGLVQIAVWLSTDSAAMLKRLAAERGLSATKIVEQAIAALAGQPTEPTEPASSVPDVQALVSELAAALEGVTARVAALEAPRAPVAVATDAEGVSEIEPARIALPGASTAMPESVPVPIKVFTDLPPVERAKAVGAMRDMRRKGVSYLKIGVAMFNDHGLATDGGKPLWPGTVRNLIGE